MQAANLHRMTISLSTLCIVAMLSHVASGFQVIPERSLSNPNLITLRCRSSNTTPLPNAMFWLNTVDRGNELSELGINVFYNADRTAISFSITQELEGVYFCGSSLVDFSSQTDTVTLIAHPDPARRPLFERTFFAKVGLTAHLNCLVQPGALSSQYSADWLNASNSVTLASVAGPRTLPPLFTTPDPRYTIDEDTFSLSINPVRLSDRGTYRCVVEVEELQGQRLRYIQTQMLNLNLVVYKAPIITIRTPNQVIALNEESNSERAKFKCQARGEPAPSITWLHNSERINNPFQPIGKYNATSVKEMSEDGGYLVTSDLHINSLNAFDSGNVTCMVMSMTQDGNPSELPTVSHTSQLSILGTFNSLNILISTSGDLIFKIGLPNPSTVPVQLNIRYMDNENRQRTFHRVTAQAYNSTKLITHFEPRSMVPDYRKFQVEIALHHRGREGPFNRTGLVYDIQQPNVFTEEEARVSETIIISVAVSVTVVCLIIGIVIPVLTVIICCTKIKRTKSKQASKLERKLEEQRETHANELRRLQEKNDTEIERLGLQYNQKKKEIALDIFKTSVANGRRAKLLINENGSMQILIDSEVSSNGFQRLESKDTDQIDGLAHPHYVARPGKDHKQITAHGEPNDSDVVDGPDHSHYVARATNEYKLMTAAVEHVSEDRIDRVDSEVDQSLAMHCMKCVIETSLTHPVYGPELRTYMSQVDSKQV